MPIFNVKLNFKQTISILLLSLIIWSFSMACAKQTGPPTGDLDTSKDYSAVLYTEKGNITIKTRKGNHLEKCLWVIFKGETDERENELLEVSISSTFPSGISTHHIDGTVIQLSTFSLRKSLWLWYFHHMKTGGVLKLKGFYNL